MSSNAIAKAYVQVIPSAEGIKDKLSGVFGSEMPSAGQSAGSIFGSNLVGKISGIIAAAGIGKALSESIQAGAALEQSLGGIETLFKDSADIVIKNAEQAYKTAGMSANDYMETVTGFSASLLQSLGGDTVAAASAADTALTDMADNANKFGTDMESIKNAYQGFAKQNYTMLDNLKLGYGGTKTEMERLLADAKELTGVEYDISNLADVYSAIHVVQEELGVAGATAAEASNTLSGSFASMKSAASDLMANLALGRDIKPSMQALTDTATTFLVDNLLPAVGNVLTSLPDIISGAFSMAIRALNLAGNNAESIVQTGIDLVTGIGSSIITAVPYLAEAAFSMVAALGNAIITTDWLQIGTDTINGLRDSLDLAAGEILGTDGDIIQSVLTAISTNLPLVLEGGSTIINQLVDGIFAALPGVAESGLSIMVSFVDTLLASLPEVLSTGKDILLNVVDGIRQSFPDILVSAGDAIANLLSGLLEHLPDILAAGFDLIVSLIAGIGEALPDIITAAGEVAEKLWDAIKDIDWLQLGKDIINGLIKGIGSMGGALWDAAKNVAKSALDSIKSFFGIASPSKVMRDEVGKFLPSGVAVGVKQNTKPLTDAMHDLSDLTTHTLQSELSIDKAVPAAPVSGRTYGDTVVTINVYAAANQDVNDLAEIIMEKLQSAVSRREEQLA